jgi:hypothetical protein
VVETRELHVRGCGITLHARRGKCRTILTAEGQDLDRKNKDSDNDSGQFGTLLGSIAHRSPSTEPRSQLLRHSRLEKVVETSAGLIIRESRQDTTEAC